ncbi:hypothetical protein MAR_031442, partial [Mya arenaria]
YNVIHTQCTDVSNIHVYKICIPHYFCCMLNNDVCMIVHTCFPNIQEHMTNNNHSTVHISIRYNVAGNTFHMYLPNVRSNNLDNRLTHMKNNEFHKHNKKYCSSSVQIYRTDNSHPIYYTKHSFGHSFYHMNYPKVSRSTEQTFTIRFTTRNTVLRTFCITWVSPVAVITRVAA